MKAISLIHLILLSSYLQYADPLHAFGSTIRPAFVTNIAPTKQNKVATPQLPTKLIKPQLSPLLMVSPLDQEARISYEEIQNRKELGSWEDVEACSRLWNLTPEETRTLQHLGQKLADVPGDRNNPWQVVRFLKEFQQEKLAGDKFRAMVEWRQSNQVDRVLDDYHPPPLYRYFPAAVLKGVDKDGDPIHLERTGAADSSGLLNRYGKGEMIRQAIWLREMQTQGEWTKDYELEQGHPVKEFNIVMDMKGLSLKNIGPSLLSVAQEVSRIVQDDYPGFTKRVLVIRAPSIFKLAYKALQPFIDPSMKDKVIVAGEKDYCKILEQYMDLKVLPAEVCPQGQGQAVDGFDTFWKGGRLPNHEDEPLLSTITEEHKNERENGGEQRANILAPNDIELEVTRMDPEPEQEVQHCFQTETRKAKSLRRGFRLWERLRHLVGGNCQNHPYAI